MEREATLGGTCVRVGCIPTKAWVQTALFLKQADETFAKLSVRLDNLRLDFSKANEWKSSVVEKETLGVASLFASNHVQWIKGDGTFRDANTITVQGGPRVTFASAIIAAGSFPLRPPIDGLDSDRCVDSEGLLAQTEVPARLVILGGGVIGCEFASILQRFGSQIIIIEAGPSLIPAEDSDADLHYTSEHVWSRFADGRVRIGITDYAQHALGDVTFVRLPEIGSVMKAGAVLGEVQSRKSNSDVYSPVASIVAGVNSALSGAPGLVNDDPYGKRWICELESTAIDAVAGWMDAAAYKEVISRG